VAAGTAPTPSDATALAGLKLIKAAEAERDERLRTAHRAADEAIAQRRAEADAAVKAVAAEAEDERARAVEKARVAADAEARAIVAEGETAARAAASPEGRRPQDEPKKVLEAVLGSFAPE
jgi:vacuolar-type H+-ATPase subunit H